MTDERWIECPDCAGEEGYFDSELLAWIDCGSCGGNGGHAEYGDEDDDQPKPDRVSS